MPAHKYADFMLQYAQDAQETDTPWERWEFEDFVGDWVSCSIKTKMFNRCFKFRRKPETIDINGFKVPKPMRVAPPVGTPYFCISSIDTNIAIPTKWMDTDGDRRVLSRGICHLTESAAVKHAEALLSFTKVQK
jgi:hypothetical protein